MEQLKTVFMIDTNSLITPYQMYYPFDLVPNFWRCMTANIEDGNIVLLDKVYNELLKGQDDLTDWLLSIEPITKIEHKQPGIISKYSEILSHLQTSGFYTPKALAEWSDIRIADPWLIACASVREYSIVTFEKPNGNLNKTSPSSHPKIPDVCNVFGVKHGNLFDMMRSLNFTLS